jgi:toxin ParE1/3/4
LRRRFAGASVVIAEHDSQKNADYVLDKLLEVVATLSAFPERGTHPK